MFANRLLEQFIINHFKLGSFICNLKKDRFPKRNISARYFVARQKKVKGQIFAENG